MSPRFPALDLLTVSSQRLFQRGNTRNIFVHRSWLLCMGPTNAAQQVTALEFLVLRIIIAVIPWSLFVFSLSLALILQPPGGLLI